MKQYFSIPIQYTALEQNADDLKIKVEMLVMHDKTNVNKTNFEFDVIDAEVTKESIKNIPILGYIKKVDGSDSQDFSGHEIEIVFKDGDLKIIYLERPLGIIPETNNYEYVEKDGKKYVKVIGYLWKDYMNDGYQILLDNPEKAISMEIVVDAYEVRGDGIIDIKAYRYMGVTVLGDNIKPAMQGANMRVIEQYQTFSEEFHERVEQLNEELKQVYIKKEDIGTGDKIDIDISKEAADFDTAWGNVDKTKLRNDILKASNYKTLVKKAYLAVLDGWEDAPSENLKYPVCMIKDNTLVLSAKGCQAAYSRLEQNKDASYYDSAKKKLKKYYQILDLDTTNFSLGGGETEHKMAKKKEDKIVDEKLELIAKHNLTVEDLKFDINEISIEELEERLGFSFSATYKQKREAISNALDPVIVRDGDGKIVSETWYWLDDFDEKYCMVEKYVWTATDYNVEYGRFTYSFDESALVATITSEFEKLIKTALTQEEYDKVMSERESYQAMSAELEQLKTQIADYENKVAELDALKSENATLKEFKQNVEFQVEVGNKRVELEELVESFEAALKDNEEFEQIKVDIADDEKILSLEYSALEKELYALVGKVKFEVQKKDKEKSKKVTFSRVTIETEPKGKNEYGDAEKYFPKKD